ncbi:hypothetical protein [Actinotalea ferrariae]|uniref:hypothetical protein n=1 Tax=Actinotalea ferrariae TaxID=1386098 RepID=UPI00054EA8A4|nr:hypothetical protein [Actinotalea ferrariae]
MSETTETICHWEQVQRQWKWEWASYHPHPAVFWAAGPESGTTELLDEADLAATPPDVVVDHSYGSRWERVSGTGRDVVVATADLPPGVAPAGEGWRSVVPVG